MKYGSGAGAVCGAVSALGCAVATADYAFLAAVVAPAAAVGGMFSGGRKLSAAGGFVLTATLGTAQFGMDNSKLAVVACIFMSSAVFMLLPAKLITEQAVLPELKRAENASENCFKTT